MILSEIANAFVVFKVKIKSVTVPAVAVGGDTAKIREEEVTGLTMRILKKPCIAS